MTETTPLPPTSDVTDGWAVLRIAVDFALGIGLFAIALGFLSLGHGQAFAGASDWVTVVVPASGLMGSTQVPWHWIDRDAAMLVLAVTFGGITAFNLSIARHLRGLALPPHPATDNISQ